MWVEVFMPRDTGPLNQTGTTVMRSGALLTQAAISNITATCVKCSVTQRWLNQLATVMRSGALLAQAESSNITASAI